MTVLHKPKCKTETPSYCKEFSKSQERQENVLFLFHSESPEKVSLLQEAIQGTALVTFGIESEKGQNWLITST